MAFFASWRLLILMRQVKYPLIGLLVLVAQIMLLGKLEIFSVTPDFLVIFIIYTGLISSQLLAIWLGFVLGFLADAVLATQLAGLSALGLSITGYLSGLFQVRIVRIPILLQYLLHLAFILLYFLITVTLYFQDSGWSVGSIFFLIVLPKTLYTYLLLILSFIILRVGMD